MRERERESESERERERTHLRESKCVKGGFQESLKSNRLPSMHVDVQITLLYSAMVL